MDEDSVGSVVTLSIASAFDAPLVQGPWQLCFTWMKAVVLRRPMASNSGSYVGTPRSRSGRRSGEEISIDGRSQWLRSHWIEGKSLPETNGFYH